MIQTVTLKVFYACLFSCALLVLFLIWNGGPPSEVWAQIAVSLFVIGLACFLVRFTLILL